MKMFAALLCAVLVCALHAQEKKPDDEGFIRNWIVLDPIQLADQASTHDEENQKAFFDKDYIEGQKKVTPKDGDKVKVNGTELIWKAVQADDYFLPLVEQNNTLNLAVTYIVCENEVTNVQLKIGSDDSSLWLLNGEEVMRVYYGRGIDKDQNGSGLLTLKKGVNVLMAAVINGEGGTGLCARFVTPLKTFTVAPAPTK